MSEHLKPDTIKNLRRRVNNARRFPLNTCPASRHLHIIAERLASGKPYPMLEEEPEHCATSMLSVLESLWKLRTSSGWEETMLAEADKVRRAKHEK